MLCTTVFYDYHVQKRSYKALSWILGNQHVVVSEWMKQCNRHFLFFLYVSIASVTTFMIEREHVLFCFVYIMRGWTMQFFQRYACYAAAQKNVKKFHCMICILGTCKYAWTEKNLSIRGVMWSSILWFNKFLKFWQQFFFCENPSYLNHTY